MNKMIIMCVYFFNPRARYTLLIYNFSTKNGKRARADIYNPIRILIIINLELNKEESLFLKSIAENF